MKAPPPGQLGPLRDASRANILREVDASLKRLRTDWVDVLLVHWPDAGTPFEESMRALEEVVTSGRARFVGVSNFTGAMMAECLRTRRVDVSQVGYHMLDRRQERETFPLCLDARHRRDGLRLARPRPPHRRLHRRHDLRGRAATGAAAAWPSASRSSAATTSRRTSAWSSGCAARSPSRAACPLSQLALAWVLGHPAISTALVGARTPAEVDANDAGAELELSAEPSARAIDAILAGAAGRVREFTPLRPAMEAWGEEIPAARPR